MSAILAAPLRIRKRTCSAPEPLYNSAATTSMGRGMASLRLATFKVNGRVSYGAVTDTGIIDLGKKLAKHPTLLDVLRAGAIGEARAAATGTPEYQLKDVELLPPIPAPEKIICVGINYP